MRQNHKKYIGIVGATGNVGRKIIEILLQRALCAPTDLLLYASARSAGQHLILGEHHLLVQDIKHLTFKQCRLIIFATESDIAKQYVPQALAEHAKIIDTSSAYRLESEIPLIVPPVNKHLVTSTQQLLTVANCIASPITIVLHALHDYAAIHNVLISTYQSISGAGKNAMDELYQQTKHICAQQNAIGPCFTNQIAFNIIPQIDDLTQNGFTYEESKIMQEIPKILAYSFHIAVTAVRVPVMVGHSISLFLEFSHPIDLPAIQALLDQHPNIQYTPKQYKTPIDVIGCDDVFVSRIRQHPTNTHGLLLWITADNLRRGAAVDAVEIAEIILKQCNPYSPV